MLAIKLQRVGKKHQPSFRFIVAEAKSKMAGPPVEDLGAYNPFTKTATLNKERALYWIGVGAQPTVSVHNLLVAHGVVTAPKKAVKMKKAVVKAEAPTEAAPAAAAEALAATEAATPEVEAKMEAASEPEAPKE